MIENGQPNRASLNPFRLWYLFFYAAQYTQLFLPLLLSSIFLYSASCIGLLMALRRFLIAFGAPIFTAFLDRTRLHQPLLLFTHILYYSCSLLLSHLTKAPIWIVTIVLIVRELCVAGCEPSVDNATVAKLDQLQLPDSHYGRLRFFGSIGWGVASVIGSVLVDRVFNGNLLVILYIQVAIGLVVIALVAQHMDLSPQLFQFQQERKAEKQQQSESQSFRNIVSLLRTPRAEFCLLAVMIQGVVLGTLQTTTFIYFSDRGVSTSVLGFSVFLSCIVEGLVFFFSESIWRVTGGAQGALQWDLLFSSIVLVLYSLSAFLNDAMVGWWFLFTEVLNGATYAMFLTAAVGMVNELAPPGMATAAQGLLMGLGNGLGPCLGAAVSGSMFDYIGAPRVYASLALIQLFVLAIGSAILRTKGADRVTMKSELSDVVKSPVLTGGKNVLVNEYVPLLDTSDVHV